MGIFVIFLFLFLVPASTALAEPVGTATGNSACAGVGQCGSDGSNCTTEWPAEDCKNASGTYLDTCKANRWCKDKKTGSSWGGAKAMLATDVNDAVDDGGAPGGHGVVTAGIFDQALAVKTDEDGHAVFIEKKIFYLSEKQSYVECAVATDALDASKVTATCQPYKMTVVDRSSESPAEQAVYESVKPPVRRFPSLLRPRR
jgi:hypothetical protein